MSFGVSIAVQGSAGGTITAYSGASINWSNTSSVPSGYTGFTGDMTFVATPSSGYTFSGFEIWIDTTSESYSDAYAYAGSSTNNPLSLSAGYASAGTSYCVYAVFTSSGSSGGDSGGTTTGYSVVNMGTWSTSTTSKTATISTYNVLRYAYTPTQNGTLTFSSSTTGTDTIGWINDSTTCVVDDNGYPSYYIGSYEDDYDGRAFSATAEVTAGTTYYLYVCCYSTTNGTVTLTANLESVGYSVTNMGIWSPSTATKSASIGSYKILRYAYTPTKKGTLTFSASTGADTIGWINDSTACVVTDVGHPDSNAYYIGSYTDDANGTAFSATAEVSANITYYLYVCCYNGSGGNVTLSVTLEDSRPSNWSWVTTVSQGSAINLTAAEWNSFTSRINEFRTYAGLSTYSFTTAVSGVTPINATICNEAHVAIDDITGHGTLPTKLVLDGLLYASFFNGLKNALNAIP